MPVPTMIGKGTAVFAGGLFGMDCSVAANPWMGEWLHDDENEVATGEPPQRPCPVCGRPDWCLYTCRAHKSPLRAAIYPRVESRKRGLANLLPARPMRRWPDTQPLDMPHRIECRANRVTQPTIFRGA